MINKMMLSSTHSIDGSTGVGGGLCLSLYNPTVALPNLTYMDYAIILTLSFDGISILAGNTIL